MNDEMDRSSEWLEIVRRKVEAIRFGTVQIVVHDGRVTLVESTEKTRVADLEDKTRSESRRPRRDPS